MFPSLNTAEGNQRKAFGRLGGAVEAQHFNFLIETKGNRASEEGEDEKKQELFWQSLRDKLSFDWREDVDVGNLFLRRAWPACCCWRRPMPTKSRWTLSFAACCTKPTSPSRKRRPQSRCRCARNRADAATS